ncbi:MAG: hypothetical protein CMM61_01255 [Rhodospirillaceae bacterium]|nr:hypothetical protein [Rhodospirillaceae bacterium]|tara:strand:+ start:193 stop:423 length:231 start_codon:yes stop_codon:yes gene_type:complete
MGCFLDVFWKGDFQPLNCIQVEPRNGGSQQRGARCGVVAATRSDGEGGGKSLASIKELEEAIGILKARKQIDAADD